MNQKSNALTGWIRVVLICIFGLSSVASLNGETLRIHGYFRIAVDPVSPHFGGATHVWGDWAAEYDEANVSQTEETTLTVPLSQFTISQVIGVTALDQSNMEAVLRFSDTGVFASAKVQRVGGGFGQDGVELNYLNFSYYFSLFPPGVPVPAPPPQVYAISIASDPNGGVVDLDALYHYAILSGDETPSSDIHVAGSGAMGSVLVGGVSEPRTLTVSNYGFAPLTGLSVNVVGAAASEFLIDTSLLGTTLAPGECVTISLTFTPAVTGVREATLEIQSNDPDENPFELSLLGEGVSPFAVREEAYVKAADTSSGAAFGRSVAVSGSRAVVGAPGAQSTGLAYVYVKNTSGQWQYEATLSPMNGDPGDRFGESVSISGDTIVVGAMTEDSSTMVIDGSETDNGAEDAGAAYVFVRNGSAWSQEAYLKASNAGTRDFFGCSVSISGDTVVVGAYNEDNQLPPNLAGEIGPGAAYVFSRNGGTWNEQQILDSQDFTFFGNFGRSVSISNDVIVVGAPDIDKPAGNGTALVRGCGGVFVFFQNPTTGLWFEETVLFASNSDSFDHFGYSVAVSSTSGVSVIVGAYGEDGGSSGIGGDGSNNDSSQSGAAYVFQTDGFLNWIQSGYLKPSHSDQGDRFGISVGISGSHVVVGAELERSAAIGVDGCDPADNSLDWPGAAYLFRGMSDPLGNPAGWSQRAYLKASNTGEADYFGGAVGIDGETVIVGAVGEDSNATGVGGDGTNNTSANAGAAYLFRNPQQATNARSLYDAAAAGSGLTGNGALPTAIPFGDGVENLVKYAFNMDLSGPDSHSMTPGGTSGLPSGHLVTINQQTYWRFEYVIRTGSSLSYRPVKSTSLTPPCPKPLLGIATVTTINSNWKRVTIDEPYNPADPTLFFFVQVFAP